MGVRHKDYAVEGVQFHPESILTEHGHDLLKTFLSCEKEIVRKSSASNENNGYASSAFAP